MMESNSTTTTTMEMEDGLQGVQGVQLIGPDIFEVLDCVNGKFAFKSTINDHYLSFQMFGIKLIPSLKDSEQFEIYKI
jgi:hypothetical protein